MTDKDITIVKYDTEKKEEWNAFNRDSINGLFMFDRDYMDYHSDRFLDHSLMFYYGDELIAILPANDDQKGEFFSHQGLTYGGFVFNEKMKQHIMVDCFDRWFSYLDDNNFAKVAYKAIPHIFHRIPAEEDIYLMHVIGADVENTQVATTLNLENRVRMSKGRKAQISRAKREGVEIYEREDVDSYMQFFDLENELLKEHHGAHTVHSAEEMILLHSRFPQQIRLFTAEKDEQILAGAVIYEYSNVIHTQYLGSFGEGRIIGALDYLITEIVFQYSESKRWMDFGTSSKEKGRGINFGLISQKEGFGGRSLAYTAYEFDVKSAVKRLKDWITRYD